VISDPQYVWLSAACAPVQIADDKRQEVDSHLKHAKKGREIT